MKRSSVGLKGSPAGWLIPTLPMEIGSFLSFVNFQKKKNCFSAGNDLSSKVRFKQQILFFLVFLLAQHSALETSISDHYNFTIC